MDIKPIRTEADYQAALREVDSLMTAEFGTPEGDRLDVLATLVETYEAKHFPKNVAIEFAKSLSEAIRCSRWRSGLRGQLTGRTSGSSRLHRPRTRCEASGWSGPKTRSQG